MDEQPFSMDSVAAGPRAIRALRWWHTDVLWHRRQGGSGGLSEWTANGAQAGTVGFEDDKMEILEAAEAARGAYLGTGEVADDLLIAGIGLAYLDFHTRNLGIEPAPLIPAPEDLDDLRQLLALVPDEEFRTEKTCVLNPTFGEGSRLVGGADADALLDQALIEIKTITTMKLDRDILNQLAGYYVLSRIGGVEGQEKEIADFAVYYSRFGKLVRFPVADVIDEDGVAAVAAWFRSKAG